MPGPYPTGRRQRAGAKSTRAVLSELKPGEVATIPKLFAHPEGSWHPMTLQWWIEVWQSPMRTEFTDADRHGLMQLAMIVNDFYTAVTPRERQNASAEIRLQSVRFGLSPMDRRRLEWQIESTEEAQRKGQKSRRRAEEDKPAPPPAQDEGDDPRTGLYAVS